MDNEQAKTLRGELAAIDDLLSSLLPEDDLLTLVTDERRRGAVATMVGTITLARNLLTQARDRVAARNITVEADKPFVKRPRKTPIEVQLEYHANGRGNGGRVGEWVLSQLAAGPKLRNELAIAAMTNGLCTASTTAYGAFKRLISLGKITFDEESNKVALA